MELRGFEPLTPSCERGSGCGRALLTVAEYEVTEIDRMLERLSVAWCRWRMAPHLAPHRSLSLVAVGHRAQVRDRWPGHYEESRSRAPALPRASSVADSARRGSWAGPCRSPCADLPVLASWLRCDCAGITVRVHHTVQPLIRLAVSVVAGQRAGAGYLPSAAGAGSGCASLATKDRYAPSGTSPGRSGPSGRSADGPR